ncbi:unnamed protein product [Cladocopium goreaui]|uniref:Uncharacterized protein n=1 Tax=Cladocopium goreaui TaxID=2562237 RepID=A0A9P1D4R1_9DINO|nr:unnamed protein product [Cladocopium goreaui]
MPSGWNPFLYIKTAFGTIEQVKYVPGSKKPDKPDFVDRFLFWRRCALRVGSICSLMWLVCSLHEFQAAWRNVRDKLDQFPEMVRPYFSRFIYAELACQTASEMASVIAVFIFMRAWKEHENFERSSDLTRLGWFFNTMGPFLPYLLVPLSFFFRVDYFQRDVCASVIGMMAHDPMSSLVFSEAASQASEPDLSAALSNPLAKPPRFGEPGFDTSPAADWCWRYYTDWQPRLFSEKWMGTAMNDIGDGHNVEIPRVFGPVYPGVVPKALEMLAALFGAGHAFTGDFCNEKDPSITKENLEAVGEADAASLLEGDWIQQHFSIDSNEPSIASLRQKLIKVYQNMTHQSTAQAARARQIIKEVQAAGMASFRTLSGGDFFWPLPESVRTSEKKAPASRQKFFRQRDSVSVGPDGQFSKPVKPQELLETAAPDLSAGLGKEAICTFKSLMIAAMKMCSFCYVLVTTAVSMYCAVSYSLPLASLILGVVDGMGAGVTNVKSVLYRSCLPGYLQSITVFVTLPGILFIFVFFSQIGGSPLLSLCMCALAGWRAMDFYMGEVAIDVKSSKKLEKATKKVNKRKQMFLLVGAGLFVAHTMYLMYAAKISVKLDTSGAKDAIIKKIQDPISLGVSILKIVYVRVFTNMVTTNWIMEAVFDAADDTLKVKKESGKHVEEAWAKLTQGKRKKKKKKKKDKDDTEEEGYYDEEGWYYPPPGAEEFGEVPDMPPAVAEGEAGPEVPGEGEAGEAVPSEAAPSAPGVEAAPAPAPAAPAAPAPS